MKKIGIAIGLLLMLGSYEVKAADLKEIRLPRPDLAGKMTLEQALYHRRSVRAFSSRELNLEQIGQLLWAAQGITDAPRGLRAAPSAGALYPLKVYLIRQDGAFSYQPKEHKLTKLAGGNLRPALAEAALGQASVAEAPISLVISGNYSLLRGRYGGKAELFTHLEAGHVGQNIQLQAVALGLASVPVGAFEGDKVTKLLKLSPSEIPLYIFPVGYLR